MKLPEAPQFLRRASLLRVNKMLIPLCALLNIPLGRSSSACKLQMLLNAADSFNWSYNEKTQIVDWAPDFLHGRWGEFVIKIHSNAESRWGDEREEIRALNRCHCFYRSIEITYQDTTFLGRDNILAHQREASSPWRVFQRCVPWQALLWPVVSSLE